MKRCFLYLSLAALILGACAKDPSEGLNDDAKLYLDSWIRVNHPGAQQTALGAYILDETPGTGASAGSAENYPYVRVRYTVRNLAGSVQSTTEAVMAQQLGTFKETDFYGPTVWNRSDNGLTAGLEESVSAMCVGGHRTVLLPGWLQTLERYDTAKEYIDKVSGTPVIYELTLEEVISDIKTWETDSLGRYISANFPGKSVKDSLEYGIYYFRTKEPESLVPFSNDTTIYVNYIGRRLDGVVFDTNIADTAKFYGIYSASKTYGPATISWYNADDNESYTDIKMTPYKGSGSTTVIHGFSFALDQMYPYEQGTAVFYSNWGYGTSGSDTVIPGYSPLRFDFQIVDKP